jgi:hypothetical protein
MANCHFMALQTVSDLYKDSIPETFMYPENCVGQN